MSRGWSFKSGDWNFTCDVCGKKLKASEGRKRWDGFMVCSQDWEPRQSLDFVKAGPDKIGLPWSRPQPPDSFVSLNLTVFPTDNVPLTENIQTTADYWRYIGRIVYPNDLDLVNGAVINLLTINSNSVDPTPPTNLESVSFVESLELSTGFNISINDSIVFSENVSEVEGEFPVDTVGLTETVLYVNTTNKLINAHLVNEVLLG
jgi:hypothetical protein